MVSGKKKKFACHICGKEYNTKQYVKQHVKSIHKQADGKQPIVAIDPNTQTTKEWFYMLVHHAQSVAVLFGTLEMMDPTIA